MTDWKEYPNLFCNGKFNCKVDYEDLKEDYKITGIHNEFFHIELEPAKSYDDLHFVEISQCKLIARSISDLSEEEMKESPLAKALNGYDVKMFLEVCADNTPNRMNSEQMIYLLSIGVYPFDQNDFKTGTVINVNEL